MGRFDHLAEIYGKLSRETPFSFLEEVRQRTSLLPSHKLLELGCGSGVFAKWFANQGIYVDAIDLSMDIIKIANTMRSPNLKFHHKDAIQFMMRAISHWNVILFFESLHLFIDNKHFPGCLRNVIAPGGKLVVGWRSLEWEEKCKSIIMQLLPQFGISFKDWGFWTCPQLGHVLDQTGLHWIEESIVCIPIRHSSSIDDVVEFLMEMDRTQTLMDMSREKLRIALRTRVQRVLKKALRFDGIAKYYARIISFPI